MLEVDRSKFKSEDGFLLARHRPKCFLPGPQFPCLHLQQSYRFLPEGRWGVGGTC